MNALVKPAAQGGPVVAGVALPKRSGWLVEAMRDAADLHPDVGFQPGNLRPGVREEAQRQLAALDAALRSADADDWRRFLLPFAVLPRAPQGKEAFAAAIGPIAFTLAGTPAVLLTPDLQRAGLAKLRWWPTPADIADLLAAPRADLTRERAALARIANAPEVPQRAQPTPEEREHMAAQARALAAELAEAAAERQGKSGPGRPVHVSDGALLAAYERAAAAGNQAAAFRARALRAKLGDEA